jgi:hypothetical protein
MAPPSGDCTILNEAFLTYSFDSPAVNTIPPKQSFANFIVFSFTKFTPHLHHPIIYDFSLGEYTILTG